MRKDFDVSGCYGLQYCRLIPRLGELQTGRVSLIFDYEDCRNHRWDWP
jgi:hypothetical protein